MRLLTELQFCPTSSRKKQVERIAFFYPIRRFNPSDWYVISRERVCNRRRRMASRASVHPPAA